MGVRVGASEGGYVGVNVGCFVSVGAEVGIQEGLGVGDGDGLKLGFAEGSVVGSSDGRDDGSWDGRDVGNEDGSWVGLNDGDAHEDCTTHNMVIVRLLCRTPLRPMPDPSPLFFSFHQCTVKPIKTVQLLIFFSLSSGRWNYLADLQI